MGYTTEFRGSFSIDPPLKPEHREYLQRFADTRRMKRSAASAQLLPDPVRELVGLPIGTEGEYFVGGSGFAGQDRDPSIVDYNSPPITQPALWCQWVPTSDGAELEWDGNEKFYNYIEWLEYLILHFFSKWGYTITGTVEWSGEDSWGDTGTIVVDTNKVRVTNR